MSKGRPFIFAVCVALLYAATVIPTLGWAEFSGGMENLNVATALETLRTGNWITPTLDNASRTNKPPLPSWVTAWFLSDVTVAGMSSTDASTRDSAYARFMFEARLPGVVMASLTILAGYALGYAAGLARRDRSTVALGMSYPASVGLLTAVVLASNYLFLRHARSNANDIHLTLWVTAANACIAYAIFGTRRTLACALAGACVGVAVMCKGPVAIVQSVAPAVVFALWARLTLGSARETSGENCGMRIAECGMETQSPPAQINTPHSAVGNPQSAIHTSQSAISDPQSALPVSNSEIRNPHSAIPPTTIKYDRAQSWFPAIMVGTMTMLLVALPWPVVMMLRLGGQWEVWWGQITAQHANEEGGTDRWYRYFAIIPIFIPWLIFLVTAMLIFARDVLRRRTTTGTDRATIDARLRPWMLAICMIVVPLVVLSFFGNRKERYALPVVPAMALLTALAGVDVLRSRAHKRDDEARSDRVVVGLHWGLLCVVGLGVPLVGMTTWVSDMTTHDGRPWFGTVLGATSLACIAIVLIAGILLSRRSGWSLAVTTLAVMLGAQVLLMRGYGTTDNGQSDMKPLADDVWKAYPLADVYTTRFEMAKKGDVALSIYLNRPTVWISPEALPSLHPGPVPKVLVVQRHEKDQTQTILPAGWTYWRDVSRDKSTWRVFVMDAGK